MSSGKVGEDAVPEVLVLAAAEENVDDGLSPLSAASAGTCDGGNVSVKEKVIESNLLGPQLHQQRALTFAEPLVELQHLLSRRWRVSVCRAALVDHVCIPRPLNVTTVFSLTL